MRKDQFRFTTDPNPHVARGREIVKKYPEVRELMGPYPLSALYILVWTAIQVAIALYLGLNDLSWGWVLLASFLIGAIMNHGLFAMMHEAAHDLIVKGKNNNRILGIICNLAQGFPSAIGFRTFHIIHHAHMSEYDYDADMAFHKEAQWVGRSPFRKIIWFLGFLAVEAVRPMRLKKGSLIDLWLIINFVAVIAFNTLIYWWGGPQALGYLLLSTFFAVGLHPVGARWIQEHYLFKEDQETYSYYGILNKINFNIGYHNEHHDLFKVPWIHLPKLKAMAPEFYDELYAHQSWTKLLLRFIFDKNLTLYSRIVRPSTKGYEV